MKDEEAITAAELMARLESDPAYQKRREEKRRRRELKKQHFARLMEPTITELNQLGCIGDTIHEIIDNSAPFGPSEVEVLLDKIGTTGDSKVDEWLIRSLAAASCSFDARPLTDCFDSASSEGLKWAIISTISIIQPAGIDDWIQELCKKSYWKKELTKLGYYS